MRQHNRTTPVQRALLILGLACIGSIAWTTLHPNQPVYQGRSLSDWLVDLDVEGLHSPDQALHAVRTIGTNALPVLMKMVCSEDPLWKRSLLAFNARQSLIQFQVSSAIIVRSRAVQGYAALGPVAGREVSGLMQVLDSHVSDDVKSDLVAALGAIGPEAKPAIPLLWKLAQTGSPQLRERAFLALSDIQRWDESRRGGWSR